MGHGGQGFIRVIGKSALESGSLFALLMGIGGLIRCEEHSSLQVQSHSFSFDNNRGLTATTSNSAAFHTFLSELNPVTAGLATKIEENPHAFMQFFPRFFAWIKETSSTIVPINEHRRHSDEKDNASIKRDYFYWINRKF